MEPAGLLGVSEVRNTKSYVPQQSVSALLSPLVYSLQFLDKKIGETQTRRGNSCLYFVNGFAVKRDIAIVTGLEGQIGVMNLSKDYSNAITKNYH